MQVTFKLLKSNTNLLNQRINGCNIIKGNSFARMMIEEITRSAKFEIKCPFKAGFYRFESRDRPKKNDWLKMMNLAPSWVNLNEQFAIVITFTTRQKKSTDIISHVEYYFYVETLLS
jgi:hypothetical protein